MTQRKRIATYGRRGQLVRVNDERVGRDGGRRLVRVQWNESPGAPLSTASWPYSKEAVAHAKAFAQGVEQRLAAGAPAPRRSYSVGELARLHVEAEQEAWAPATLRNFSHRWGRFEAFVGRATNAGLVTEETVDEFRAAMRRAGVATNQRSETVKVVKQLFRWARRRKLIAENPLADYVIKLSKAEQRAEVPEWSPRETAAILAQLEAEHAYESRRAWRLLAAIAIAATQGPRQGALLHLTHDDVNLRGHVQRHPHAAGVVLPPRSVWWNPAHDKLGKERIQPLTRDAVRALRVARVWAARDGYAGRLVFYRPGAGLRDSGTGARSARAAARAAAKPDQPWSYQTAISGLRAVVDRIAAERGGPIPWVTGRGFHGFRKHAAGEAHRVSGSERESADWIGDNSVVVVRKHYLKKRSEAQRELAAKLNAAPTRTPSPGVDGAQNRTPNATAPR